MNVGFDALLRRELASGFDTLHGLQLSADIPLREALLNTLVRELPHSPRDARVEIAAGNRITLRAGVFQATAVLDDRVELRGSPYVCLQLASTVVAFGLRALRLPPYVVLEGRLVTIDLARVPALAPYQSLLGHLKHATLVTRPGVLHVGLDWRVD